MTLTRALSELVVGTRSASLPTQAVLAAKRMIIDSVAATLAGWKSPGVAPVLRRMQAWGGAPEATVLTYGAKLPSPQAAFVNGVMCHALDYDDVYYECSLHIMASVFPTALAFAEITDASGRELIDAVILGVEVAGRIGLVMQAANTGYGFLPSSVVGGFGATAAACRLLGLSVEQTVNALGISYAQASGNRQALLDTTLTKRMQPAYAARSAAWAAVLAAEGVTGPARALEGEAGFFKVYVGCEPPTPAQFTAPPDYWQIEHVSIKPFPSCGGNHRVTQAAISLMKEEGLRPEEIERVEVWLANINIWFVGHPFEIRSDPQVDAQFSAAYSVATALVNRKAGLEQYRTETVLSDQAVLDMLKRVQVFEIPNSKGLRAQEAVEEEVKVWTRDGRMFERRPALLHGQWQDPYTMPEVHQKLEECMGFAGLWTSAQVEQVRQDLTGLDSLGSVRELVQNSLTAPRGAAGNPG
jgi:2-methylcitrate dehydratase PrpD